jgi:predicted TIM-barrel fold metal-dependent hydrolase
MIADEIDEEAIDPAFEIVDAHHHLWPIAPSDQLPRYRPDDLRHEIAGSGHKVVATVYVDSHANHAEDGPPHLRPAGETRYAESIAATCDGHDGVRLCAAIVASADLREAASSVGELLDAHMAASPRFRGIRQITAFDDELGAMLAGSTPGVMDSAEFRAGFGELARRGLSFDAFLFHPQIGELSALAATFPDTRIILDHIATPLGVGRYHGRRDEVFATWRAGMSRLADAPNVVVKIGGLNMNFGGTGAAQLPPPRSSAAVAELQRDYILTTIDLFTPARCMFESNFPVDRGMISYRLLWNVFKRVTRPFSDAERLALFKGTATDVYRIDTI